MSFVCACLVVLLHSTPAPAAGSFAWWWCHLLGREGICAIAVPYFFLAAGFLLAGKMDSPGWWKRETLKRVRSLVVPFYVWMVVYLFFGFGVWFMKGQVFHQQVCGNPLTSDPLMRFFVLSGLHPTADLGVLWFLRVLFFLVLTSAGWRFLLCRGRCLVAILFIVYLGASWLFACSGWNVYAFFDRFLSVRGALYFVVGMALRQWGAPFEMTRSRMLFLGVIGVSLLVLKNVFSLQGRYPLSYVTEACTVPLLMVAVFFLMPTRKWADCLTGNAFAIFLMHNIFLSLVAMALMAVGLHGRVDLQLPIMYLRAGVAIGASICLAWGFRRCFPRSAAVVFGGR